MTEVLMRQSSRLAAACAAVLLIVLAQASLPKAALAAGCDGRFQVTGLIGQKWNDFNGPTSALGCPTSAQEAYKPGFGNGLLPVADGTQQQFQHGIIVNFPSLGSNMLLSAWYNGTNSIHVEFTGLAKSYPHFYVGLANGVPTLTNERYTDFVGGTGHHADIPNPFPGAGFVSVRLLPCDGTPYVCAPHAKTQYGTKFEDPTDGKIVVGMMLDGSLSRDSLASNAAPTPSPTKKPDYIGDRNAPPPAPAPGVDVVFKSAQSRGYAKADGGISSTFNFCSHDCQTPTNWLMSINTPLDPTQRNQAVVGPFVGYVYDTDKELIKDGFSNFFSRYAMRFDLSTLPDKPIIVAHARDALVGEF